MCIDHSCFEMNWLTWRGEKELQERLNALESGIDKLSDHLAGLEDRVKKMEKYGI